MMNYTSACCRSTILWIKPRWLKSLSHSRYYGEGFRVVGKFTAGEAMERALIGHGVLLPNPTTMEEDEYEDILKAQEIYDGYR